MSSLYCSRCGLRTKVTPASLLLENCPRCLARDGTVAPFVVTLVPRQADRESAPAEPPAPSPQPQR
jgi:hypothetical protein